MISISEIQNLNEPWSQSWSDGNPHSLGQVENFLKAQLNEIFSRLNNLENNTGDTPTDGLSVSIFGDGGVGVYGITDDNMNENLYIKVTIPGGDTIFGKNNPLSWWRDNGGDFTDGALIVMVRNFTGYRGEASIWVEISGNTMSRDVVVQDGSTELPKIPPQLTDMSLILNGAHTNEAYMNENLRIRIDIADSGDTIMNWNNPLSWWVENGWAISNGSGYVIDFKALINYRGGAIVYVEWMNYAPDIYIELTDEGGNTEPSSNIQFDWTDPWLYLMNATEGNLDDTVYITLSSPDNHDNILFQESRSLRNWPGQLFNEGWGYGYAIYCDEITQLSGDLFLYVELSGGNTASFNITLPDSGEAGDPGDGPTPDQD